jgi:hypothetical protein
LTQLPHPPVLSALDFPSTWPAASYADLARDSTVVNLFWTKCTILCAENYSSE